MIRRTKHTQRFSSAQFQLLHFLPHAYTFFIHHHSSHHLRYLFPSHNSCALLRHAHRHPELLRQHESIHLLLSVKRPRHHGNAVLHALQNGIPTAVRHETPRRRMFQDLGLRGSHGNHNPHPLRPFQKPFRQVTHCSVTATRITFARKLKIRNTNCSLQPLVGRAFGTDFQLDTAPDGPCPSPAQGCNLYWVHGCNLMIKTCGGRWKRYNVFELFGMVTAATVSVHLVQANMYGDCPIWDELGFHLEKKMSHTNGFGSTTMGSNLRIGCLSLRMKFNVNNDEETGDGHGNVNIKSRDNPALVDNNTAQSLTGEDIEAMRSLVIATKNGDLKMLLSKFDQIRAPRASQEIQCLYWDISTPKENVDCLMGISLMRFEFHYTIAVDDNADRDIGTYAKDGGLSLGLSPMHNELSCFDYEMEMAVYWRKAYATRWRICF
ncbi:Protein Ycf2 [Vigna angularis]|uniref:tRNA (adenine(58)-N(1))-methyltransferase non-catalytic subunit TRM6 n=1 Tax=Phaseolus angularis TaxID=3914 RepID=A0A8T0JPQ6_PHAAN|nr:Protein Ycf2 [Vigna angularis]